MRPCPADQDSWTHELEDLGYTVLYAEEPGQALVHVRSGVDIVVVIDGRPHAGNATIANFVHRMTEEHAAPPFVLVSESPSAPTESARLGAAAFVPQPCKAGDLQHVFARMMSSEAGSRRSVLHV